MQPSQDSPIELAIARGDSYSCTCTCILMFLVGELGALVFGILFEM